MKDDSKINFDETTLELATRRKVLKYSLVGLSSLAVAGLAIKNAQAGMANCSKCNCPAFQGSTYQCSNCGHQYTDHW
jgi:hypothetical protein